MGMAASQARYLALTARKTNTEWEGQQINQARTALANQSANLFNRLLSMEVPNAPKTSDYTTVQYSYTDGENESVLEEWHQLSNKDANYNYSVKHYYYADIFTGAKKLLSDPQIQVGNVLKEMNYTKSNSEISYGADGVTVKYTVGNSKEPVTKHYRKILNEEIRSDENLNKAFTDFATAKGLAINDGMPEADNVYGYLDKSTNTWHFFLANIKEDDYQHITQDMVDTNPALKTALSTNMYLDEDGKLISENIYGKTISDDNTRWAFTTEPTYANITQDMVENDPVLKNALIDNNMLDEDGKLISQNIYGLQITDGKNIDWTFARNDYVHITQNAVDSDPELKAALAENSYLDQEGHLIRDDIYGLKDGAESAWNFTTNQDDVYPRPSAQRYIGTAVDNKDYSTAYNVPKFIGNSKLKELDELVVNDEIDMVADLAQILRDCPDSSINKYVSFDSDGNLVYEGQGIYTFDLYGKTYYTTNEDLWNSIGQPYDPNKPIDLQEKLAYYNAAYIEKKIEATNNALLETDSNGRFKSVKFDDDSIVYNLNVETVTDEAAYQDAMNQYLYKKEQYEKTIADINAKTSIIQQEDRTLELRLKQLDTEQNALATEMDAVKKVIKDNVDKTFKTFSD